jgi:hypothetical protein
MAENPVEIPQAMRDVSEQNLQQAHAAYKQLMDFVSKTMNTWMEAIPENAMSAGFKDMQGRAMDIAMENAESTFTFAGKVNNAQTFQDIPRDCNASDAVRSRSDAGLRGADAGASQADRRSSPKVSTPLTRKAIAGKPSSVHPTPPR